MSEPMSEAEVRDALSTVSQEAADLEGLAVDLGVKLKQAEAERGAARAEVERLRAELANWRTFSEIKEEAINLAEAERDAAREQVKRVRDLLPEVDATFRRLCGRLSTEDQEALAEVYMALRHNLDGTVRDA